MGKEEKDRVRAMSIRTLSLASPTFSHDATRDALDIIHFGRGRFERKLMSSWSVGYWHATYKDAHQSERKNSSHKIDASPGIDDPRTRLLFVSPDPGSGSRRLQ